MEVRVEESNGVKKYFVNGQQYNRLEDIPEEFKSYFVDKNSNGIPDQFDSLFDSMQKNPFSLKTVKSLLQSSSIPENQNQPINKLENGNSFFSTPFKIIAAIGVGLLIAWCYFLYKHSKSKAQVNSFEGTYLSGTKKNGRFWVEVIIKPTSQRNEYQIEIKSKELKGYSCCELSKNGTFKNDTIFVQTTEWKRPVMMIMARDKSTNVLAIGAIEKQEDDRFALSYYCCGGKSLIGEYNLESN